MSIKLMSAVFDSSLTAMQKLVMLALADYAADDGTSIYPSVKTLSEKTSLSPSAVRTMIRELRNPEGLNLLSIAKPYTNKKPNIYRINVELLRVSPRDTLGVTIRHPRVSPHDTDPSVEPSMKPKEYAATPHTPSDNVKTRLPNYVTLFCTLTNLKEPESSTRREQQQAGVKWYAPLMRLDREADGSPALVESSISQAVAQMQKDDLTIQAPISIEAVAVGIVAKSKLKTNGNGNLTDEQKHLLSIALQFDNFTIAPQYSHLVDHSWRAAFFEKSHGKPLPRILEA